MYKDKYSEPRAIIVSIQPIAKVPPSPYAMQDINVLQEAIQLKT